MPNLVSIYKHTVQHCTKKKRKYINPRPVKYSGLLKNYTPNRQYNDEKEVVSVVEDDTINVALNLKSQNYNPLVLNMASERVPGGGVRNGAKAQEESLFRRTNYFMHLDKSMYPLQEFQVIHTPNVAVVKDEDYKLLQSEEYLDFIACPAVRNPEYQQNGRMSERDRYVMRQKIRLIFQTAAYHGYDCLVLGALGCGAYKCNPHDVIAEFNKVMQEYQGVFRKIVYAVNSQGRDTNFELFRDNIIR